MKAKIKKEESKGNTTNNIDIGSSLTADVSLFLMYKLSDFIGYAAT